MLQVAASNFCFVCDLNIIKEFSFVEFRLYLKSQHADNVTTIINECLVQFLNNRVLIYQIKNFKPQIYIYIYHRLKLPLMGSI